MGLESGTYIDDLVTSNPAGTDVKSQGDDHFRLIKTVLKNTLPNATGPFRFPSIKALETTADSPYTQLAAERNATYVVDATAGAFTLNLLAAATATAGFIFQVVRTDTSTNTITIDPSGAETINGASTLTVLHGALIICTGSTWYAFPIGPDLNTLVTETTVDPAADFLPYYDTSAGRWRKALVSKFTTPIGSIQDFAGTSVPNGWLLAYGQAISRTTYSELFSVIGTTFGIGDGSTTFNLPDLRGRVGIGRDDMGGAAASRITAGGAPGIDGTAMGAAGGAQEHTLTSTQSGTANHGHAHTLSAAAGGGHSHTIPEWGAGGGTDYFQVQASGNGSGTPQTTSTVSDHTHTLSGAITNHAGASAAAAHTNVQPAIIINKMIFAGA